MFFLFGSASVDLLSLKIDVPSPPGKGPSKWLYLVRKITLMPSQKNWPLSSICGRPTPTTILAIIETVTSEVIAKSILEGTCGAKIQKECRGKRRLARLGRKQDVYIVLGCIFIDRISNAFPPLSRRTPWKSVDKRCLKGFKISSLLIFGKETCTFEVMSRSWR